ncbi:SPFH domain-containing protein [Microcoleus sp. FACHB-672]|uniref:SPFH domain-containing protein n=1 Tax=Microcoleus sp. FACHB-672 TaxID=2692825 RepID=UPI0016876BC3|nr:stomatin-like protein [Microcoleus sp. FACHB-672]MBD2040473.1 paraslipin [Microcoleus sp. FACHB-672]
MDYLFAVVTPLAVAIIGGCTVRSVKIISEENEALVERLGKFHRKLESGLNFINPILDTVVLEDTLSERVLELKPSQAITKDNVSLIIDAVLYWRVIELELAYYKVQDIEEALRKLVLTTLRSEIGEMDLQKTFYSRKDINKAMLRELDDVTDRWGVKVTRVEVQEITPTPKVIEAMELKRAAEFKKQADILEAEGTVRAMELLSTAIKSQSNSKDILQFLVAQRYVEANQKLSESPNAKIVFMGSEPLGSSMGELLNNSTISPPESNGSNSSSKNLSSG